MRADLWADLLTEDVVRQRLAEATRRRRELVRIWIEDGVASDELSAISANALASTLIALTEGLTLHAALDPVAFRWRNVGRTIGVLLSGCEPERLDDCGSRYECPRLGSVSLPRG